MDPDNEAPNFNNRVSLPLLPAVLCVTVFVVPPDFYRTNSTQALGTHAQQAHQDELTAGIYFQFA